MESVPLWTSPDKEGNLGLESCQGDSFLALTGLMLILIDRWSQLRVDHSVVEERGYLKEMDLYTCSAMSAKQVRK